MESNKKMSRIKSKRTVLEDSCLFLLDCYVHDFRAGIPLSIFSDDLRHIRFFKITILNRIKQIISQSVQTYVIFSQRNFSVLYDIDKRLFKTLGMMMRHSCPQELVIVYFSSSDTPCSVLCIRIGKKWNICFSHGLEEQNNAYCDVCSEKT